MTQPLRRPDQQQPRPNQQRQPLNQNDGGERRQINTQANTGQQTSDDIVARMVNKIDKFIGGLKDYKTRELVEDTEELGKKLARDLKTTQIRKFLDAVNRLKAQPDRDKNFTEKVKPELDLLRPKLAYAAARQRKGDKDPGPVEPLRQVLEAAIKKVDKPEDFTRLVQLIESIIAYHKAAGGKDQ
jgi:CRISPR-associated protein Csm2